MHKISRSIASVIHPFLIVLSCLCFSDAILAETTQERVHHRSHHVMPFDMSRTVHIFKMTETGGIQQVLVRDPADSQQIEMIRMHLQHEAHKFSQGDFSDPARLHGADMPGLAEMSTQPGNVTVLYNELPDGGEIIFKTGDPGKLTAIHRWFGAQLSEHGTDARAE